MTNDETTPLPAEGSSPPAEGARVEGVDGAHGGPVPPAPPSPWATTQPVVAPPPSPYGPGVSGHPGPGQAPPAGPAAGWPAAEPDPWVDVTPGAPQPAGFGAPQPRPAGQGRRTLGVIGLVAAGAVAGALIVNAVDGFRDSDTAAVQPSGVSQNGIAPNGAVPGGGAQGGVQGGVPGGVPGGQGLQGGGGFGGQDGEQRLTGTLTAVSGSKVTVRTSSGSATYQLVSQTQIVRNGELASASELKAGDRVLVHVFPANGSDGVLERLIAVSGTGSGRSGTQGNQDGGADT